MARLHILKVLIVGVVAGALIWGGAGTALASSGTGNQNPDLTVAVSLVSSGADPDKATVGDTITASYSLVNNTTRYQLVRVSPSLAGPAGAIYSISFWAVLAPGKTYSASVSYPVLEAFPAGLYTVALSASNYRGASTASASLEVY